MTAVAKLVHQQVADDRGLLNRAVGQILHMEDRRLTLYSGVAGGALKGGKVYGRWPGLAEADLYAGRDLMPTADLRAYGAWALAGLFGTPREMLERSIFPGLDMGADPRFLA